MKNINPELVQRMCRRFWISLAMLIATITIVGGALAVLAWKALKPHADEWSQTVHVGSWSAEVSVPVLLRWGTHPLVLPLLNNRLIPSRAGLWYLQTTGDGNLYATCAPCVLRLPALGTTPVTLTSVMIDAERAKPEAWQGTITLGEAKQSVVVRWSAKLRQDGLQLKASMPPTAIDPILAVLGDAVPEASRATVEGTFGFEAQGHFNGHGFSKLQVRPLVDGVKVTGLGTEALLTAAPPNQCGRGAMNMPERLDGWLPRAVIAAEDQRFYEHNGFDIEELVSSWLQNQRSGAKARGGSTITQQLAKMIYTGDERHAARKVREWLYAVEMERTLGKGRILQLYLAMAPWGGEVCGGEAASRRYVGKASSRLAPHEAAWLASLLTRPDAQLAHVAQRGGIDHDRVARVIESLRPMPKSQRESWIEASTQWQPSMKPTALNHTAIKRVGNP